MPKAGATPAPARAQSPARGPAVASPTATPASPRASATTAASPVAARQKRARADDAEPAKGEPRTFTVFDSSIGFKGGRYISKTPEAAARKAGRQLFRRFFRDPASEGVTVAPVVDFSIRETGDGDAKKAIRKYEATRETKDTPDMVERKGAALPIPHLYTYKIKARGLMPVAEVAQLALAAKRRRRTVAKTGDAPVAPPAPAPAPAKTSAAAPAKASTATPAPDAPPPAKRAKKAPPTTPPPAAPPAAAASPSGKTHKTNAAKGGVRSPIAAL